METTRSILSIGVQIIRVNDNEKTADALSRLLDDSYVLYLKTHNFHWNVKGSMFNTLHTLLMNQYTELALAVDEIAERIRALGAIAPVLSEPTSKLVRFKKPKEFQRRKR
jgi:starvation-inducible DNA-binding protein